MCEAKTTSSTNDVFLKVETIALRESSRGFSSDYEIIRLK